MTAHLLAVAVGPVQEFISAARRTRDLWFGSYLLSEISKAAAKSVQDHGGRLIFPAPSNSTDLDPDSRLNVANIIVAELKESDPATVARAAKAAARAHWRSFADRVFRGNQGIIQHEIWNDQVDDVIEFYASWRVYSSETYPQDRAELMRLLAARKRCRDFLPAKGRAGIPKSSLDGLRESVLRPSREWSSRSTGRFRLAEGEQLDVVGVVKRVWAPEGGRAPSYPSVARVAADPWLRRVDVARMGPLVKACRDLGNEVLFEIESPQYAAFPFEGTAVFRSRYHEFQREACVSAEDLKPLVRALKDLTHDFGEPSPYLGVLVADGDRMGRALSLLQSPEEHREFSQVLEAFAAEARQIVHRHNGVLVYAGGDDVLAFVPVDRSIACARKLRDQFAKALAPWSERTDTDLTLSVGLAIAHFMEPLEDLVQYGRAAEKHAKKPRLEHGQEERDGFAVHVLKRGGGPVAIRANWSSHPDRWLQELAELVRSDAIPGRIAYELRQIADLYQCWPPDNLRNVIQRDTLSIMKGKQPRGDDKMDLVASLIRERVTESDSLRDLANELLVARHLSGIPEQVGDDPAISEDSR
jgi:CRISPR-associated protein Cmr2